MDARWMNDGPDQPLMDSDADPADSRRALRRDLGMRCEVVSHYCEEVVEHRVTDVSPYGVWIDTSFPLHPGAEVVLSLQPPRFDGAELTVFAKVARAVTGRRRSDRGPLGMGIEFGDLTAAEQLRLERALAGIPPKVPRRLAN
ncbi:MAG: hypothetical protein DRI90_21420 [Deltaproteobacteria bacterium]|nr:MAG: hypothetical protein DRI90_21420 [Deltaproteobacteria bacterium]